MCSVVVGLIQVLGITFLPEFERHTKFGQLQYNVFSTFREANGKRQSLIRYILFIYYTGCKLVRSPRTISTTLPEKTSHQIITLSWLLKNICHV